MIEPFRQDLPPPGRAWLSTLRHDVPASFVVFLVAVPLSLGIAFASGAPLAAGLVAAIVGGVLAGLLGGAPLLVSGPAAGLTMIVAETIDRFGWTTMCAITVLAGAVQILLGLSRVARAALAVSPAIVHGMLAGIGITIVLAQLHVVFGGDTKPTPLENLLDLPARIADANGAATVAGLLTLAVLILWRWLPPVVRRVPGPLAAVLCVTVLTLVTGMSVDRVEVPDNLLNLEFVPTFPSGDWPAFLVAVLTIALVASVESLLSAVAVDKLHNGPRANLNRELVGQGAANLTSGALGGLPVTGVIVRSSTNVASGARGRTSTVLHGVWILLFVVFFAALLRDIPLAVLAGLLVHIGARLVDLGHIREVLRHGDLPVYLVTLLGVVLLDLMNGVLLGIGVSALLTLRRLLWAGIRVEQDGTGRRIVVEGALSALSIPRLSAVLADMPQGSTVTLELVVDYLDHAAFETLSSWQQAHERAGGTVVVEEVGHAWFASGKAGRPIVRRSDTRRKVPKFAPWSGWQRVELDRAADPGAGDPGKDERGPGDSGAGEPRAGESGAGEAVVPEPRSASDERAVARGTAEYERHVARLVLPALRGLADVHTPATLFLTCGDARIVPNVITTSGPGDLFTVRNIGNLVPGGLHGTGGSEDSDASILAAVEFAVDTLKVREIAVCGHSSCGAMRALVEGPPDDAPALRSWPRHASGHQAAPPLTVAGRVPEAEWDRLALHNVLVQLERMRACRPVADALRRGDVRLVGLYFDVAAARVYFYDEPAGDFRPASLGDEVRVKPKSPRV